MAEAARRIELVDLRTQRRRLGTAIDEAIARVLDHGQFILGPEVARFEDELARRCGVAHAVGCASGTDALLLALLARDIGPGSAVFVPAFTFAATAEVVALLGATPVLVDVRPDTFTVDAESLGQAVDWVATTHLRPACVIAVDLFGQPADYVAIAEVTAASGMGILADAAQSVGASLHDRPVGGLADVTATSFFPAKPLGCYGDGGAVLTDDATLADRVRSLQAHGRGGDKFDAVRLGINSRLDTLQAAVLLEKLRIFDDELVTRQGVADRYGQVLGQTVRTPASGPGSTSSWAAYTVLADDRDHLAARLAEAGVATAVYYPRPLHHQAAFARFPRAPKGLGTSERLAQRVLSLPIHPYLGPDDFDAVIAAIRD